MKVVAEQFEIDWEHPINPWAENEAREAKNWTPDALCSVWACNGANSHREWWESLPKYQQRQWLARYQAERERVDLCGRPMRTAAYVMAMEENGYQQDKALAERWAQEIREAFVHGMPCPIRPTWEFQHILDWAFDIACVPQACVPVYQDSTAVAS
jgi:hypothetical protein